MDTSRKAGAFRSLSSRARTFSDWLTVSVAEGMIVGVAAVTISWRAPSTVVVSTGPATSP